MLDIKEYEAMAMLDLPDHERERLSKRLKDLADSFTVLKRVDTDNVAPLVTVLDLNNVMREDKTEKLLARNEILSNAPEQYDGYFQVPGTLV